LLWFGNLSTNSDAGEAPYQAASGTSVALMRHERTLNRERPVKQPLRFLPLH
jgi:hypothetical protein